MVEVTISDALLTEVQQAVDRHQPELVVSRIDRIIIIDGLFVVSGPDGPFDSYQIKAGIAAGFPAEEPVVLEEGGRIPRTADRHVFPKNGNCCLGVWEEWLLTAPDHRFETFLNGPMHDYFVSQSYFEVNGSWPFGERSHGMLGVIEAYADLLGVAVDTKIIASYLNLLSRKQVKGHALCPCGSARRLRQCHSDDFQILSRRIPPVMAKQMHNTISPRSLSRTAA